MARDPSSHELEELVRQLLPVAEHMLTHYGGFYPYGGLLTTAGEVEFVNGGEDEATEPELAVDVLLGALRSRAGDGRFMASAAVVDVRVARPGSEAKTDAVEFFLEHAVGPVLEYFVPYAFRDDGSVEFGEAFSNRGSRRVFAGLREG